MTAGPTERFEPGPLDRPQQRWRLALRRLPITLAVLAAVGWRAGSVVNPILITTLEGKRIGCLFRRYAKTPARPPVIRLSGARSC